MRALFLSILGAAVAHWTAGQQFARLILHLGHVSHQNDLISPGCPRHSAASRTAQNRGLKHYARL